MFRKVFSVIQSGVRSQVSFLVDGDVAWCVADRANADVGIGRVQVYAKTRSQLGWG